MLKLSWTPGTGMCGVILGALLWPLAVLTAYAGKSSLAGVDSYYHIRFADILRSNKLWMLDSFPWCTETIWADHFFDKDWLFHVVLKPFTAFGLIDGAQTAILAAALFAGCCWTLLFKHLLGHRLVPLAMLLTLFCCGPAFFARLLFCRPHVLSIGLFALVILCGLTRRRMCLGMVCAVYALAYTGSWQAVFVCSIIDVARIFIEGKNFRLSHTLSFWAAAGVALGTVVNPYFPLNLEGGFLQNVMVLKSVWLGVDGGVSQGAEFQPPNFWKIVFFYSPLLTAHAATTLLLLRGNCWRKAPSDVSILWLIGSAYLLLTLLSQKFTDYSAPSCVAAAFAFWAWRRPGMLSDWRVSASGLLVGGALGVVSLSAVNKDLPTGPPFHEAAEFLKSRYAAPNSDVLKPGEIVFTGGWDDPPVLFHHAPQFRYLVFLEPYFMYARSPQKYRVWRNISEGRSLTPAMTIRRVFGARIVFTPPWAVGLARTLDMDSMARLMYSGRHGERIYELEVPPEARQRL